MRQETYFRIERFFRRSRPLYKLLLFLNTYLTMIMYIIYPVFIIFGFFTFRAKLFDCILAPLLTFMLATFFRYFFNSKRPYEVMRISPLIRKNSSGRAFPSRHVACAFAIAAAIYYVAPAFGVVFFVVAFLIALIRVIGGVHFISDVLFGALLSADIALLVYVIF